MKKIRTVREFCEANNEGRCISREDVAARVLQAKVWLGMVTASGAGYLPETHIVGRNRRDVESSLAEYADTGDSWGPPKGLLAEIRRTGSAEDPSGALYECTQVFVSEMF